MARQLGLPRLRARPLPAAPAAEPEVGSKVGAMRWPGYGGHPDGWGRPWSGIVLARTDPRAWAGSIAFGDKPSPAEVWSHVIKHWDLLRDEVPVLWFFQDAYGKPYEKIFWSKFNGKPHAARPYAEDLQAWMLARANARGLPFAEAIAAVG